ncbi:unnamed protein product [Dracunculus medinensis]|uniref:Uncharacterized protein n=1 Tax=Dracunculus medinensis TaxID=318479 RepID=A0A0N4UG77_DRAME|nr:unnamed protein product [Dracunculus medinensis]
MNVLLFEEREVCTRCGGDERNCSSLRNLPAAQLQLPPFVYSSHSSSVSPQRTSPSPYTYDYSQVAEERRRICLNNDGRSNSFTSASRIVDNQVSTFTEEAIG